MDFTLCHGSVSWNYFRYIADYLHLGGMVFGLLTLLVTRSAAGFSKKTQLLLLLVFVTRYLDVFVDDQEAYLLFFKFTFNVITIAMVLGITILDDTYDATGDSCNMLLLLIPTAMMAYYASPIDADRIQGLWTFSEFLEPLALVPQYIVCYRAKHVRLASVIYISAVGGYRVLYVFNWLYKRYCWHSAYNDYTSWIGGALECMLFFDFVIRVLWDGSFFGGTILKIDDRAGRISKELELKTLGRRLPFGVGGAADDGPETSKLISSFQQCPNFVP